MTTFGDDRTTFQKLSASAGLQKRDTKVIAVETVKDTAAALDFAGELNAVRQRMAEAVGRDGPTIVIADPGRATDLTVIGRTMLSYTDGLLHDAKEKIAEEEYDIALRLLDELIGLEPEEDSREVSAPVVEANGATEPAAPAVPTLEGVATGKGWARRNDPCPCGSGKKYKRCHGA